MNWLIAGSLIVAVWVLGFAWWLTGEMIKVIND